MDAGLVADLDRGREVAEHLLARLDDRVLGGQDRSEASK